MSSARLQDTRSMPRNELYFYILAMNNQEMNIFLKKFHLQYHQNETLKIKFNKRSAKCLFYIITRKYC